MKKLVAVMTCWEPSHFAKTRSQRMTWVPGVQEHADVVFFRGRPPAMMLVESYEGDVTLDVDDSYRGIPLKVQAICRWAVCRHYDYMAKVDDDVYIVPKRFDSLPLEGDYIGRFRGPHGNKPVHFASGFMYWLSARALLEVAATKWNGDWMDERFIASVLARRGMFGSSDPVSYQVTGPHLSGDVILGRKVHRDGTVFCEYSSKQLIELHDFLRYLEPIMDHPGLRPVPAVSITEEQLCEAVRDQIPTSKLLERKWKPSIK